MYCTCLVLSCISASYLMSLESSLWILCSISMWWSLMVKSNWFTYQTKNKLSLFLITTQMSHAQRSVEKWYMYMYMQSNIIYQKTVALYLVCFEFTMCHHRISTCCTLISSSFCLSSTADVRSDTSLLLSFKSSWVLRKASFISSNISCLAFNSYKAFWSCFSTPTAWLSDWSNDSYNTNKWMNSL